jgi:hypothetical protein
MYERRTVAFLALMTSAFAGMAVAEPLGWQVAGVTLTVVGYACAVVALHATARWLQLRRRPRRSRLRARRRAAQGLREVA